MYKGEHHKEYNSNYFLPIWLTQHYTQLANYHLLNFETSIIKKAKRTHSAALPVCCLCFMENTYYEQVFENWFKLQNIWQKSSKHSLKILWVNFTKLFNNLVAFIILHKTYCFTLPTSIAKCQWVCRKHPKASSFFWIFLCRNSSLTKATDSCFFLLKKYLTVVNLSHITLSLNHSIMSYNCCWRRN